MTWVPILTTFTCFCWWVSIIHEPWRTLGLFLAVVLVMQNVHTCCLLRQKADEELWRMETTVGEPTDVNRVRIFIFEKQKGRKQKQS